MDFRNLKSQCYFKLAQYVNEGKIWIKCDVSKEWNEIIEEFECIKNRSYGTDNKIEVLRKVDIYDWGFEIRTKTLIDAVGVKAKSLKKGLDAYNMADIDIHLKHMIGDEFQLPHNVLDPLLLKYFWDSDLESVITDNELDKILSPTEAKEGVKIMDIGQKSGSNILLE